MTAILLSNLLRKCGCSLYPFCLTASYLLTDVHIQLLFDSTLWVAYNPLIQRYALTNHTWPLPLKESSMHSWSTAPWKLLDGLLLGVLPCTPATCSGSHVLDWAKVVEVDALAAGFLLLEPLPLTSSSSCFSVSSCGIKAKLSAYSHSPISSMAWTTYCLP